MKTCKRNLFKTMVLMLPLFLLCSCYEIVFVNQESDIQQSGIVKPVICVQVYSIEDKPAVPYVGMLVPASWSVMDGFALVKETKNYSIKLGSIFHDKKLSAKMEHLDPSPSGYVWWVGKANTQVSGNGVFKAFPVLYTTAHGGLYSIDYMVGDSEYGLNQQRSNDHTTLVASSKSPTHVKTQAQNRDVLVKWMPPLQNQKLMGYYVFRNNSQMNDALILEESWTDYNVPTGSYSYSIVPVYFDGTLGIRSRAANICFTPCGTSMQFDGIDDKVLVFDDPSLQLGTTLTLEAWIKQDFTDNPDPRIISKGCKGEGYELLLSDNGQGKSLEFRMPFGILKSTRELLPNQWYHLAAVYDGKLMKIFINGRKDCERIIKGRVVNSGLPLVIGKNSSANTHYFQGLIDEVRIWNFDRTEAQIFENYSSRVDPESEGLVGNWTMSEGCAGVTCDLSKEANNGYLAGSCWSPATFPYVEDAHNQSNPGLVIPVMNLKPEIQSPQFYNLEFKINPKLLKFEGIVTESTQLKHYSLKTQYLPDGTVKIKAFRTSDLDHAGDVLLYIDVKALQPHVKTTIKFNQCLADGAPLRIRSGKVIATAVPGTYKSGIASGSAHDVLGQVYPNPASDHLMIPLGELQGSATLQILDITGRVVCNQTLEESHSNTTRKIDLLGFSKGIYLINLQHNGQVSVKKIAVN